jgi:hypothetical protein
MKRMLGLWVVLAGCGGASADITGNIGGFSFDDVRSVYSGGPYVLLFDRELDCLDAGFNERSYQEGSPLPGGEFVALQLHTGDEQFTPGSFTLAQNASVGAIGLINGEELQVERGREGTITFEEVDPGGQFVAGTIDIAFGEGSVSGSFRSEYCRNMVP